MTHEIVLLAGWLALVGASAGAEPLPVVVEFENSRGLEVGDPLLFEGKTIGKVTRVGFGERDTVEVHLRVDDDHRHQVRTASTFVINEPRQGGKASIELFIINPASPPARPDTHFQGTRSIAEVWLRRGRINADELARSMSRGVEEFRRNLEELQRSKEWAKFKDQLARLSAQLTVTGTQLSQLLNEQLPKLQRELDDLYEQYLKELERQKSEKRTD
jgi:ABC-type transporter Mla subunit MlaD